MLVVGFAAGEIPKIPLNLTLLKGCSIVGVFWGDDTRREPARWADSVARLGRWYAEGRLRPHISECALFGSRRAALRLLRLLGPADLVQFLTNWRWASRVENLT